MGFLVFVLLFLTNFVSSLLGPSNDLRIGVKREVKNCKKFIEDENMVYAHIVARIDGNPTPVLDTYKDNRPMYFKVNDTRFIPGFNLGMRGACEGEIRRITIPPKLAYKSESVKGLFDSGSTWIVDAEILEVIKEQTI